MNVKILTLCALLVIFNSACSGTYQAYYQTLEIAFSDQNDAKLTLSEVQQSSSDVISVRRGERPTAIMALAYIEKGQYKWVSSDNVMLIMDKGRIIRTIGLSENLMYLSNLDNDPLKSLPSSLKNESKVYTWSRIADQTGDEYGYPIESIFSHASQDTIQALDLNIETFFYVETLSYKAPTNYLRLSKSWKNYYWYAKNGELIKSIQKTSPLSDALEMTYLSRIARLNH